MLTSTVIAALNHLLTDAPWARDRLKPFAGRTAVIQVAPAFLCVAVEGDGFFSDSATADTPGRFSSMEPTRYCSVSSSPS